MGPSVFLADVHGFSEHSNTAVFLRFTYFYFLFYSFVSLSPSGFWDFPWYGARKAVLRNTVPRDKFVWKTIEMRHRRVSWARGNKTKRCRTVKGHKWYKTMFCGVKFQCMPGSRSHSIFIILQVLIFYLSISVLPLLGTLLMSLCPAKNSLIQI